MLTNKRQELYFATVVFMFLTIHFFGNAIGHLEDANEIEDNCDQNCTSLEEDLVSLARWNGFYSLFVAGIMAVWAWFFWPVDDEKESVQISKESSDNPKSEERKWTRVASIEEERLLFIEVYRGNVEFKDIEPRLRKKYRKFDRYMDEKKEQNILEEE